MPLLCSPYIISYIIAVVTGVPQARPCRIILFFIFAPVVGLLCAHCHARTSTERERQRKVGQPVRPYVFIFKTTSFTNAPRLLCDVFLDFPSAHVSRRLFASNIHAPACMFRQSANAKGTPDSLSSVGVFIDKTTSFANALRLLCDVFLDFRSRSARGRSATFKRSFGRQSAPSLP